MPADELSNGILQSHSPLEDITVGGNDIKRTSHVRDREQNSLHDSKAPTVGSVTGACRGVVRWRPLAHTRTLPIAVFSKYDTSYFHHQPWYKL